MMTAITDQRLSDELDEAPARVSILIVDDDVSVRTSLRRLLQVQGYVAVAAANGGEALQKAGEIVPDLILMDLHLAHERGADVARSIKSAAALQHIPVIAMTSMGVDSEELRSLFPMILRKPFAAMEIRAALERGLRIWRRS